MLSLRTLMSASIVFVAAGCNPAPSTFGLAYGYESDESKGHTCVLAGNAQGGMGALVEQRHDRDGRETLPHLWVASHQEGGSTPYSLEVFVVRAYEGETSVPKEKEVLKSVSYDEAFGAAGKEDAFTVEFEGKTFTFHVAGIPAESTSCPDLGARPAP